LPLVLNSIILGRSTALVCDSGDSYSRVVSVHDGYCLTKSARYVTYAGDYLTKMFRNQVEQTLNCDIPTLCKLSG
jgi:actin-related protein